MSTMRSSSDIASHFSNAEQNVTKPSRRQHSASVSSASTTVHLPMTVKNMTFPITSYPRIGDSLTHENPTPMRIALETLAFTGGTAPRTTQRLIRRLKYAVLQVLGDKRCSNFGRLLSDALTLGPQLARLVAQNP